MITLTTTLPESVIADLKKYAEKLNLPKNKFIERSLTLYFEHLKRAEYIKSYKEMDKDEDLIMIAEEDMASYYRTLEKEL